jgi:hypothetical protein
MKMHTALRFVTEWPQAVDGLTIEIQFGGVLQAQYNRVLAHAGFGALDVRGQHIFPPQPLLLIAGLVKKAVGRLGPDAIGAGARDARRGLVGKVRCNFDQPLGLPCIAQLRPAQLFHCPVVHALHCAQRANTLRHPPLIAGNRARKYGRRPGVSASRGMMNVFSARVCPERAHNKIG